MRAASKRGVKDPEARAERWAGIVRRTLAALMEDGLFSSSGEPLPVRAEPAAHGGRSARRPGRRR